MHNILILICFKEYAKNKKNNVVGADDSVSPDKGENMEKKEIKISLGTIICIFIIVILLIIIGMMYCKMKNINNEKEIIKQEEVTNTTDKQETENLRPIYEISKAYAENGYFYYSISGETAKRYEGLSNVAKVKVFNIGTGINNVPFLITEDGTVYEVKKDSNENIKAVMYKPLKNYKVEDILNKTGETKSIFKLLLKDKTTKEVEVTEVETIDSSIIEDNIKEYILTEFGPKGNMEDVIIKEVKILPKEDSSKNMYLDVNIENSENILYGNCIYSITLKDPNKLTMEGSKSSVDKLEGNVYTLDADFTYDKTTNKVKFYTSYGFGN